MVVAINTFWKIKKVETKNKGKEAGRIKHKNDAKFSVVAKHIFEAEKVETKNTGIVKKMGESNIKTIFNFWS